MHFWPKDSFKLQVSDDYSQYELFSVIIHSGNAYGGHYHTYIRDFDKLGNWSVESSNKSTAKSYKQNDYYMDTSSPPLIGPLNDPSLTNENNENENKENVAVATSVGDSGKEIVLVCSEELEPDFDEQKELVNLDYFSYNEPLELLKAFIYNKHKYEKARVEQIVADLNKATGTSWNKRFKSRYGTVSKFLKKHNNDTFELSADECYVQLRAHDRINIVLSSLYNANTTSPNDAAAAGASQNSNLIESCLKEVDESGLPSYNDLFPEKQQQV